MENYHAEVLPEEKAMLIREGKANGAVIAMVGNGLDDAAALVEADLGIAMGDATDLASKQEVVLFDSDVRKIPRIFDLARKTMRVVRQNLFWAIFYNALGVALAVSGILNPTLAAAAMALSSLWVVGN